MSLAFKREPFSEFKKDWLGPLSTRHWEEIAKDRDRIKLSIDTEKYQQMDDAGILHILTARENGVLVGYHLSIIMVHPHYKDFGKMAMTDVYYLAPEYRNAKLGIQMLDEVENSLREIGVKKAYTSCKADHDLTPLFFKMGWRLTDYCFTKLLD